MQDKAIKMTTTCKVFLGNVFDRSILDMLHHRSRRIMMLGIMEPEIGIEVLGCVRKESVVLEHHQGLENIPQRPETDRLFG